MKLFVEDENLSYFGHLRAVLQRPPTDARWREVLNVLHALRLRDQERYEHEQLPYAINVLQRCWPQAMRRLSKNESMALLHKPAWHHLSPLITQGLSASNLNTAFHLLDTLGEGAVIDRCELAYLSTVQQREALPTLLERFRDAVPIRQLVSLHDVQGYTPLLELLARVDQPMLEVLELEQELPLELARGIFRPGGVGERLRGVKLMVRSDGEALMRQLVGLDMRALTSFALRFVHEERVTGDACMALARAPWLERCERVKLGSYGPSRPSPEGWRALLEALSRGRVREMYLEFTSFLNDDFQLFLELMRGSKLEELGWQGIGDAIDLERVLLEGSIPDSLRRIHFKEITVSDEVVMRLAAHPALAKVELDFCNGRQNTLASMTRHPERHEVLVWRRNHQDDAALAQLRKLPLWHTIRELDLRKSRVGDAGIEAMMRGEAPRALRRLDLSGLELSLGTWHALLEHPDYGQKEQLHVGVSYAASEERMQQVFDAWVTAGDRSAPLVIPNEVHQRSVRWLLQQPIAEEIVNLRLIGGIYEELAVALLERFEAGSLLALRHLYANYASSLTLSTSRALLSGPFAEQVTLEVHSAPYDSALSWLLGRGSRVTLWRAELEQGAIDVLGELLAQDTLPALEYITLLAPWEAEPLPLRADTSEGLMRLELPHLRGVVLQNVVPHDLEAFFDWLLSPARFPQLHTVMHRAAPIEDALAARLLTRLEQHPALRHVQLNVQDEAMRERLARLQQRLA